MASFPAEWTYEKVLERKLAAIAKAKATAEAAAMEEEKKKKNTVQAMITHMCETFDAHPLDSIIDVDLRNLTMDPELHVEFFRTVQEQGHRAMVGNVRPNGASGGWYGLPEPEQLCFRPFSGVYRFVFNTKPQ